MSSSILACGRFQLDMSQPKIMAIINVTADSFSGDGCPDLGSALLAAERAVKEGAEILDIGGESSRPGATMVSEQQELDRVVPLVEALAPSTSFVHRYGEACGDAGVDSCGGRSDQ
jgi:dihydropteroate synthase